MTALTNAINANSTTPLSTVQGGLGVSSPTAHGVLVAEGASAVTPIVLTDGQLLIGSTGADPVGAQLTAGSGITITNAAGSVTIANSAVAEPWTVETSGPVTLAAQNGYVANASTSITFNLPATAAVGDVYQVNSFSTGGFVIAQATGQSIVVGNETTTSGASGSITSASTTGDWVEILCVVANTGFMANVKQGQVTVA